MGNGITSLKDLIVILKRRKWSMILPVVTVFVIAMVLAFTLPPVYRSESTILIEDQEVPRDFVSTTVTSFADQRLQSINQRIMGTTKLLDIINRFGLYPELKNKWTTEEIIAKLRKDIKFKTISADVIDPRSGQARPATIAFSLSYDGKNPQVVQRVANDLASLYLEENLSVRTRQSQGTTNFMEDEMKNVQSQLADVDSKIAVYKQRNVNTLPELAQVNLSSLDSTERETVGLNYQLRTLQERESAIESQLATLPTDAASQDKARLSELRVRLVELKARLTDEHPDVIKTRNELAELIKQLRASGQDTADNKPDNPAYVTLSSQLASIRSEITSTRRHIETFNKKRDELRQRLAATPGVEEGYKNILLQRNNLQQKFDELSRKFMEAKVSSGMEKEQKGERFTLIDAARLPEKPIKPNVPAILLIGLVLGIGCGIGLTAINEQSDDTMRTPEILSRATSYPVLASIPEIITWQETVLMKKKRRQAVLGVFCVLLMSPLAFHFMVMDLDIFWAKFLRTMARM
ncbi:MAG: chain-length determining protein [Geobacteraceae bacterium GWC2_55_20]|nr:MAG: chain-length determining protein [Geobacteraceae bacterium GWC2_55_20]OGU18708.1 MAG: chain-length determining protein [Geobacteraceae bacterium GWF2_54_21]HBA73193.1 chain-length determining protein [Geobacter sp.]HCE67578.1 chain-length determining protein [Geobacter sp.]